MAHFFGSSGEFSFYSTGKFSQEKKSGLALKGSFFLQSQFLDSEDMAQHQLSFPQRQKLDPVQFQRPVGGEVFAEDLFGDGDRIQSYPSSQTGNDNRQCKIVVVWGEAIGHWHISAYNQGKMARPIS
jgi:hypothetical protein